MQGVMAMGKSWRRKSLEELEQDLLSAPRCCLLRLLSFVGEEE
jgi:hypothetical protein